LSQEKATTDYADYTDGEGFKKICEISVIRGSVSSQMKILVTGGAGFIGSHLVRALLERGDAVRVLDNFFSGRRSNLAGLEVELIEGDITNAEVVKRALLGITHVLHLAAVPSVPRSIADPLTSDAVNVVGTLNVLVAARDLGIQRVVFASSSAVYGEAFAGAKREDLPLYPLSPYGVSKLAAEKYGAAFHTVYGLETVALRYFNVFGPRQDPRSEYAAVIPKFIQAVLDGRRPTIYGDGEQTRDFTYVANVVQANLLALEAPSVAGQAFNIAAGNEISLNRFVRTLIEISGHDFQPEYTAPRKGDILHSVADISQARASLEYGPFIDFSEGLTRTFHWYREHRDELG
jgi:nucleoside-diphosphate-sugar epimerase